MSHAAFAQSTIFNIPSTDTVDFKKVYAEFDFLPQVPGPDSGSRTYFYNPRVVVGLPGSAEVGVNFPTFHADGTNGYIEPNVKWKYFKKEDKGLAATAGGILHTALNNRDGQDTWGLVYGNFSKKFKGDHGARITAGPYGVINKDPVTYAGPRGGAVLGYEQPLSSKISFVADWFSGKNYYGYFTPGVMIALPHSQLNAGYSIGNDSWADSNATKNRYVFLYYGVTF